MLNAIMESVLVCPIIMKIRLLVVDQNVYLTMIALETKLAWKTNARILALEHVPVMQFVM